MGDIYRHLTNYAINKKNAGYISDNNNKSHKRLLSNIFSSEVLELVYKNIGEIVIKSIIAVLPTLQNGLSLCKRENYNTYFQLLGYDILITDNFKFKLLEINQNPSLYTDTVVDSLLKREMLESVFNIVSSTLQSVHNECADGGMNENKMRFKDRK